MAANPRQPLQVPSTATTAGGIPTGGTQSASAATYQQMQTEIDQLRKDKLAVQQQMTTLAGQRKGIVDQQAAAAKLLPVYPPIPAGQPNAGQPDTSKPPTQYVDPESKQPVDTANIPLPSEAADTIHGIDAQLSGLLQRQADIQQQLVAATSDLDTVARQVAVDEDPATLEAFTRQADKEKLALAADQSALDLAKTKADYDAAYQAGFPAGDKARQDAALGAAQAANTAATAAFNQAQATGADIDNQIKAINVKYAPQLAEAGATKATAEAGSAVAAQSSAESKAIADQQAAAGGIGTWTAAVQQYTADAQRALAEKYGADTAQQQLVTEQTRAGEAVTRINQLREAIKKGALTKEAAGDAYFNLLYGGDQFQRNTQASKNALDLQQALITAGMAVRPDQQYIVGGEPGGMYSQGMQQLGYAYTPTQLKPTSLPAWATAAGVDISPRQGLPQGSPFDASGNFNPAFQSPLQAQPAGAPAWATAPAGQPAAQPAITDARGGAFRARLAQQQPAA
jgi:hypothetical protein